MNSSYDIPTDKGAYVLILNLGRTIQLSIGKLGSHQFAAGYYLYIGSAQGAGGLSARVGCHLERNECPHWHIDYLLKHANVLEVWAGIGPRKQEKEWAKLLRGLPGLRPTVPRFGASEYHRSHVTHLFYAKKKPRFAVFEKRVRDRFGPYPKPDCISLRNP